MTTSGQTGGSAGVSPGGEARGESSPSGRHLGRPIRVAYCWLGISGYMAACYRAISKRPRVDFYAVQCHNFQEAPFDRSILEGVRNVLMETPVFEAKVIELVAEFKPDVVVLCGWASASSRKMTTDPRFANVKFVMTMDTPFRDTLRQRLGRYRYTGFFARMDRVVVTGERSWQLARHLGIPEDKLVRGMYGIDYDHFKGLWDRRAAHPEGWPRRFLYTGRYAPEKAIDTLVEGYRRYREMVKDPWPLSCMGHGAMKSLLANQPGITDLGFVQPPDQPRVSAEHGVFVIASRYDPWPLVIVESCAAGLPIVCSYACGSAVELVRPHWNGQFFGTDHPQHLAQQLRWMHEHHDLLPEWGKRSRESAAAYSAQIWADRWTSIFEELTRPT